MATTSFPQQYAANRGKKKKSLFSTSTLASSTLNTANTPHRATQHVLKNQQMRGGKKNTKIPLPMLWNPFHNKRAANKHKSWTLNATLCIRYVIKISTLMSVKSRIQSVLRDIGNQNLGRMYEQWHHVLSCNRLKRMLTSSISIQSMPELLEMFHGRRGVKSSIW